MRHAAKNRVPTTRHFDGLFQFRAIEIGRIGCDLALLLISHRVDFGLRSLGINDAMNSQTAFYADHWKPFHWIPFTQVRNWHQQGTPLRQEFDKRRRTGNRNYSIPVGPLANPQP
jgi:hypothetical protein